MSQALRKRVTSEKLIAYLFALPAIVIVLTLYGYPIVRAFILGFYKWNMLANTGKFLGLKNYLHVLQDYDFWHAAAITLIWVGGVLVLQILLGIGGALLLNEPLWGRNIARGLVMFPWVVPTVVAAVIFRFMFNDVFGFVNYALRQMGMIKQPILWLSTPHGAMIAIILITAWKWFPFFLIMFLSRLQTISKELYDAAKIDGANFWKRFMYITLPMLMPVILIALLFRTIWLIGKFDIVWLFTHGGPGNSTTTLALYIYMQAFERYKMGIGASIAFINLSFVSLIVITYLYFYQRAEERLS